MSKTRKTEMASKFHCITLFLFGDKLLENLTTTFLAFFRMSNVLSCPLFSEKDTGKKKPDRARDAKKAATDNQNDSSDDEDTNQAGKLKRRVRSL